MVIGGHADRYGSGVELCEGPLGDVGVIDAYEVEYVLVVVQCQGVPGLW